MYKNLSKNFYTNPERLMTAVDWKLNLAALKFTIILVRLLTA